LVDSTEKGVSNFIFISKEILRTNYIQIGFYVFLWFCVIYLILKAVKRIKSRIRAISEERERVRAFLELDIEIFKEEELSEKIKEIRKYRQKYPAVREKIVVIKNYLNKKKLEKEEMDLSLQIICLKDNIEKLEEERRIKEMYKEDEIKAIEYSLDLSNNPVFERSKLNKKEIKALLKNGYKQVNEYCIYKKKVVGVFVAKILNHSFTHTFLVWSVKQVLEKFSNLEEIRIHETRFPDLTFRYKDKYYAIEIETGTLLKKKNQLKEKIEFLNSQYKNRWLIVVSNRNLFSKYAKFGPCTQRKEVWENVEKMLKI
jgi:hypothetical protein